MIRSGFILYAQPRTGSTLLGSLLASHPRIAWAREPLHPRGWQSPRRSKLYRLVLHFQAWYLLAHGAMVGQRIYGCKLPWFDLVQLLNTANKMNYFGWKSIYLTRRDVFAQMISLLAARQTHRWQRQTDKRQHGARVFIPVEDLLIEARYWINCQQQMRNALAEIPHLGLVYEDDLACAGQWQPAIDRVFGYLGLPAVPVQTTFKKTWEQPYQEIVINYDELITAFRESEYASFMITESGNQQ